MQAYRSRAGRAPLAFTATLALSAVAALTACTEDQPATTAPSLATKASAATVGGNVIMVTNTLGSAAFGSLQWAVYLMAVDGDIIRFDPSIAGDTIRMDTTLALPHYVTIEGPADKGITISGREAVRVMDFKKGGVLRNVNVKRGYHDSLASGILSYGPLTLENSAVYGNRSYGTGAAIFANGDLTLRNSTVTLNYSSGLGSGIRYPYNSKLSLINSTIYLNTGGRGIAPHGLFGTTGPQVLISNSILSKNGDEASQGNCYDTRGFNYVGMNIVSDYTCGYNRPNLKIMDPLIESTWPEGGPTVTATLQRTSPAINAGVACDVQVDQRYVPRDIQCDIGAFEFNTFNVVTLTIDPNASVARNGGPAVVTGTVTCSLADPAAQKIRVELMQDQKAGKTPTTVQAVAEALFTCDKTVKPWSAVLTPSSGAFAGGDAKAKVQTTGTPVWYKPSATSSPVRMVVAHR